MASLASSLCVALFLWGGYDYNDSEESHCGLASPNSGLQNLPNCNRIVSQAPLCSLPRSHAESVLTDSASNRGSILLSCCSLAQADSELKMRVALRSHLQDLDLACYRASLCQLSPTSRRVTVADSQVGISSLPRGPPSCEGMPDCMLCT